MRIETERLELRPMDEGDLDALVDLDAFEEVRSEIDPFAEHIPDDPGDRRDYERRFLHPAGFLAAIERSTGRFLGWFQLEDDRGLALDAEPHARGGAGADAGAAGGSDAEADARGGGGAEAARGLRRTEVEIGYRFRPDAWGEGFATEGAAALLADALARPRVVRVYAHSLLSNPGSIAVMERIGMTYVGPWSYRGPEGAEYEARPAGT